MNTKSWKLYLLIIINILFIGGWSAQLLIVQGMTKETISDVEEYVEDIYLELTPREPNAIAVEIDKFIQNHQQSISGSARRYFEDIRKSSDDHLPEIPDDLVNYLDQHAADLTSFRDRFLQGETPDVGIAYDVRNSKFISEIPSFSSLLIMTRLFMLRAIQHHQMGQVEEMRANLDAVLQIVEPLQDRHEVGAQFVKLRLETELLHIVQRLDIFPHSLQEKFQENTRLRNEKMLQSMRFESYYTYAMLSEISEPSDFFEIGKILSQFSKPYLQVINRELWKVASQIQTELQGSDVCRLNVEEFYTRISPGRWKILDYSDVIRYQLGFWTRSQRFQFSFELTEKVHQVKALTRQQGKFPESVPGIETSTCAGSQWRYTVNPDGTATLDLEGIPEALEEFSSDPSWRYTLKRSQI